MTKGKLFYVFYYAGMLDIKIRIYCNWLKYYCVSDIMRELNFELVVEQRFSWVEVYSDKIN